VNGEITKLLYTKVKTESTPEEGIGRRNCKITETAFHQKSFGLTKRETQTTFQRTRKFTPTRNVSTQTAIKM
jgi:hypothetical protein